MNTYQELGYESRAAYLRSLADEYGVNIHTVRVLAELLGPTEDFDGLVTAIQDFDDEGEWE